MTISFQTPGPMDIDAAMTFGHSSKRIGNPIGYFGTGLKYAIAVILRNGGKVTINTNGKTYGFSVKGKKDHNGNDCWSVFMGNVNLRFSPTLGRNWSAWQAFRELYCNTKDEEGVTVPKTLRPRDGHTTIVVSGWDKFEQAYNERSKYFIEDREPIYRSGNIEVYRGESSGVYYRGILVHALQEKPTAYTYNILAPVHLTEDRTMSYGFQASQYIGETILRCQDDELLEDLLTLDPGYFENGINLAGIGYDAPDRFLDKVAELRRSPRAGRINKNALDMLDKARPVDDGTEAVRLTDGQKQMLEDALVLLERRFPDVRDVPLIPVATLGAGVYGLARRGKMYVSLRVFEAGFVQLVGTIFEEYSHVTKDFRDESRDFQNYLINLVAQLLEERYA